MGVIRIMNVLASTGNERGVATIIVALSLLMLAGFAALAIDVGHIMVVRNELQNAADAAALAGARSLYNSEGTAINTDVNQIARDTAIANLSESNPVEVSWTGGNTGDVQRGHWSFGLSDLSRGFYPADATTPVDLWGYTKEDLDADVNFINAVQVTVRRQASPVQTFFGQIFGLNNIDMSATSVAYLGFAGTVYPEAVTAPIAVCEHAITTADGRLACNIGRMTSGVGETAAWTDFNQEDPCLGGTNDQKIRQLIPNVCSPHDYSDGNPRTIEMGQHMAVINGQVNQSYMKFYNCWEEASGRNSTQRMILPVIECSETGGNVTVCAKTTGVVEVELIWMTWWGADPDYSMVPAAMEGVNDTPDWSSASDCACSAITDARERGQCIWNCFVSHFGLTDGNGSPAPYQIMSLYYRPNCDYTKAPMGRTGGENYGILAAIPVLVD